MVEHTQTRYKVSPEEYEARYAGRRYEYIDGYAVPMGPEIEQDGEIIVAPTKLEHGIIVVEFSTLLRTHVGKNDLGIVIGAETGFVMNAETGDIRAADIAFIPKERLKGADVSDWVPFPPDLAVEVISQYEKASAIRDKVQEYMENGTRLLLLIYPSRRLIDVYRPGQPMITLQSDDTLDCSDVVPGFAVPVKEIFAVLDELENE